MPLRDHFRPPLSHRSSWEGFHGGWPMVIVQHLRKQLPKGYVAEPRVHLGAMVEIDVATFEHDAPLPFSGGATGDGGGVATMVWAPAEPTLAVEVSLPQESAYEVLVYDASRGRELVAAVEIVSPANKDRAEHRGVFIAKCAALLQKGVAVSIVDLVTVRHFNLYAELLSLLGQADPTMGDPPTEIYAASICGTKKGKGKGKRKLLQAWSHVLAVGQPLPTLPLWLGPDRVVPLMLEPSYEQACNDLWIA